MYVCVVCREIVWQQVPTCNDKVNIIACIFVSNISGCIDSVYLCGIISGEGDDECSARLVGSIILKEFAGRTLENIIAVVYTPFPQWYLRAVLESGFSVPTALVLSLATSK
jgi:hypothetical protein